MRGANLLARAHVAEDRVRELEAKVEALEALCDDYRFHMQAMASIIAAIPTEKSEDDREHSAPEQYVGP